MLMPFQVTMLSSYLVLNRLEMLNTHGAIILPAVFSAFPVFLIYRDFCNLPKGLIEAARIDGASTIGIFFKIILPLSKPIIATVAVFCFIGVWNDYIWPMMILPYPEPGEWPLYPIQNAINTIQNIPGVTTGEKMASLIVTSIPIFIVYVAAQKYIVQGFGSAGLKM